MRTHLALALLATLSTSVAAGASEAERYTSLCIPADGREACLQGRARFIETYEKAIRQDYTAQRNVAYMLGNKLGDAVPTDRVHACAWRMVIVLSGSPKVDSSDRGNMDLDCGRLPPDKVPAAKTRASAINREILAAKGTKLPKPAAQPKKPAKELDGEARPLF